MPDKKDPKKPTIDERLEALTQSVELLAAMQRDNDERWNKASAEYNKRFAEVTRAINQNSEHIRALVRIVEIHEHRSPAWKATSSNPPAQ